MREFFIPNFIKSTFIEQLLSESSKSKNFLPIILRKNNLTIYLPRHFGFCYGVKNAIEIALSSQNNKKRYVISQLVHNPIVNSLLEENGIKFLYTTYGENIIPIELIDEDSEVIVPAFGASLPLLEAISRRTKAIKEATCPFVIKVWNRGIELAQQGYSIIIHGKHYHEETKATFSRIKKTNAPTLIIRDISEARLLGDILLGNKPEKTFFDLFEGKFANVSSPLNDFDKIAIINQTTMLASETIEIMDFFLKVFKEKYGNDFQKHIAQTKDTLCYATHNNQRAAAQLLNYDLNFVIVIGGYNSSNTTQLVRILKTKFPVYHISHHNSLKDNGEISHWNEEKEVKSFLPLINPVKIGITAGASTPSISVEDIIKKLLTLYTGENDLSKVQLESKK